MTKDGVVTSYGYDGWGNLIQETVNGVTTEFVLDENTTYRQNSLNSYSPPDGLPVPIV